MKRSWSCDDDPARVVTNRPVASPGGLRDHGVMSFDPNLTRLLRSCSNDDLKPLAKYVLDDDAYKAHRGIHHAHVDELVKELRENGGNSLLNAFRKNGVPYAEIVRDVADKLDVEHTQRQTVERIELAILTKLLERSVEKMGPKKRRALEETFHRAGARSIDLSSGVPLGVMLAQAGVQMSGFLAYQTAVQVAHGVAQVVLGRGFTFATYAGLTQAIGVFAGPVGWAVTGAWTLIDVAGPGTERPFRPSATSLIYARRRRVDRGRRAPRGGRGPRPGPRPKRRRGPRRRRGPSPEEPRHRAPAPPREGRGLQLRWRDAGGLAGDCAPRGYSQPTATVSPNGTQKSGTSSSKAGKLGRTPARPPILLCPLKPRKVRRSGASAFPRQAAGGNLRPRPSTTRRAAGASPGARPGGAPGGPPWRSWGRT